MKKLEKIKLKKSDYLVLNDNELGSLKGGERTQIACKFGQKIYQCINLELNCPNSFTTGDCGVLNTSCSKNFSTTTF
jgi:natural product precursor